MVFIDHTIEMRSSQNVEVKKGVMLTLGQSPIVTRARTEVARSQGPQLIRGLTVEIVETVGTAVRGKC